MPRMVKRSNNKEAVLQQQGVQEHTSTSRKILDQQEDEGRAGQGQGS